jgi:signal transduction histidine kinase
VELGAQLQAQARGIDLKVSPVAPGVTIDGDLQVLAAAISNLLQNAFKFTREHGSVSLKTRLTGDRVAFEVWDECGGLPPGKAEELFQPYVQRGSDRSGVGLGLAICLKAAKASRGELLGRDLPGKGCVFTLDLPRQAAAPASH